MATPTSVQIAIIGGGPAGVAAALHIAARVPELTSEMVIFEASEYPRPKICGGGITFHAEEQLRRLNLQLDVPAVRVNRVVFQLGERRFATPCQAAMCIVQRSVFDAALAQAAVDRKIEVRGGEKLLDLTLEDDHVGLTTTQGRYRARMVIAADGANSTVRRRLGLRSHVGIARLLRVVQPASATGSSICATGTALFDFSCVAEGIQGYMWDFPSSIDGRPYVNHGIFDSRIDPMRRQKTPHGQLKRVFARYLRQRNIELESVQLQGHPVRWFDPQAEFSRPHVLLAGDAAGVDSLFAEGISYAIEYGAVIADAVAAAFAHNDFSFSDYGTRLARARLSRSLARRRHIARHLYRFRHPWFWAALWRAADLAPAAFNQSVGAALDVLPPLDRSPVVSHTVGDGLAPKGIYREMAIRPSLPPLRHPGRRL
jgi:flavin-dependent dehydrogenase